MGVLVWLESNPLAVWVHESPSVWAQPTVLTLHTMGMAVLVGASWVLDLRLLGISRNIPLSAFRWVFRAVAVSLIVNVVTGVLLFAARATLWGTAFPFLLKMVLVVASAATLLPLRSYVLQSGPDQREVSSRARWLAIISIVTWAGAITAGRLLAYTVAG
jgi:predicted ferric reductase